MMMRAIEIEEEFRFNRVLIVGIGYPELKSEAFKLTNPRIIDFEPTILQSEFDDLPQKTKHQKKRKFHN